MTWFKSDKRNRIDPETIHLASAVAFIKSKKDLAMIKKKP